MVSFGARLEIAFARYGRLCVGIDPHPYLLAEWGLADSAAGLREFGLRVVDAASGRAGIVKPQVAFFERHGAAGFAALEEVLGAARAAGILVIADAKRGDLGTSVEAYAQAWLLPGSPLESDAMTMSAYQGVGSLAAPIRVALDNGKGIFVLAATSNPEGTVLQRSVSSDGSTVAGGIVRDVRAANPAGGLGSIGVVAGATVNLADYGLAASDLAGLPVLAPGFGHQGARVGDVGALFGAASAGVVVAASRSILDAGPAGIAAAIDTHNAELGAGA
jgi:orotidine-5'-phosphate decarboxylase